MPDNEAYDKSAGRNCEQALGGQAPVGGNGAHARGSAEHSDGWELFGPNLGRCKNDPDWDAIHVLAPGETETTLCGLSLDDVAQACSLDTGYKPNSGAGCWTCLHESNRWAS